MKILINTDKTIHADERHRDFFSDQIAKEIDEYQSHITRIEVHITDQNGKKDGMNDILCLLEARIEGRQPIAVSDQADTVEEAVSGAIEHLKSALETMLDRKHDYIV